MGGPPLSCPSPQREQGVGTGTEVGLAPTSWAAELCNLLCGRLLPPPRSQLVATVALPAPSLSSDRKRGPLAGFTNAWVSGLSHLTELGLIPLVRGSNFDSIAT